MIIERDLTPYVVYSGDPVLRALEKITANKARVIFLVDAHGHLDGVLSDGDFRRWVSGGARLDVDVPALEAANTNPRSLPIGSSPAEIAHAFGYGIEHVALVDERGHLVAIAINRADEFRIGRHLVAQDSPTLVIAEIGINHQGDIDLAKRLVDEFAAAGADIVKFQLRDMEALYRQGSGGSTGEDLGTQYTLDLLAKYNLDADGLITVFDHCAEIGIDVMCTAWDPRSVDRLVDYGVPSLKVASADMTNHALLRHMAATGTPMVLSTGMSTEGEIRETVEVMRSSGVAHAFLHCQSTYPAPFKDINLAYLTRLAELTQTPVGYSGHERGFHVPVAAVALGARIIEKHVTIDRDLEGNDHKVSLLPRRVRRDGAADPRGRGGPRHRRAARGVDRRDDEPDQPRQVAGRHPPDRGRRGAHRRRHRHQEPRSRPAAQRPRQADRSHHQPRVRRRRLLLRHRPRRRRSRAVATTTSPARGAWPCATTTSSR